MTQQRTAHVGVFALLLAVVSIPTIGEIAVGTVDPFAGFSAAQRVMIESGSAVLEVPRSSGSEFAVIGAVKTSIDPPRLAAWSREVERLHRGSYVPVIQRFSDPPRIEDLAALTLDEEDLDDLRGCRPGRCDMKLSADEAISISRAIDSGAPDWRAAALHEFRQVMLRRAQRYLTGGVAGLPPSHDHRVPEHPGSELRAVLESFPDTLLFPARVRRYLLEYPRCSVGENYLYWSKDSLGDAKPIVSITHLTIVPADSTHPMTIVAAQIFATHYLTASVSLTSVVAPDPHGSRRFLLYARRSRTDVFDGPFGGIVRRIVAKRVRAEGVPVLERLRQTLEKGPPPQSGPQTQALGVPTGTGTRGREARSAAGGRGPLPGGDRKPRRPCDGRVARDGGRLDQRPLRAGSNRSGHLPAFGASDRDA